MAGQRDIVLKCCCVNCHYVHCLIPAPAQLSAGHDSCRGQCAARETIAVGAEGCANHAHSEGLHQVTENHALRQVARILFRERVALQDEVRRGRLGLLDSLAAGQTFQI